MRILVVDDTLSVLKVTEKMLQDSGHEVICASNGKNATKIALFQQVDLVLLDVVMDGMGGIETASMIRATRPDLPIVFMTGFPDQIDRLHRETVLEKPFTAQKLISAVEGGYKKSVRRSAS